MSNSTNTIKSLSERALLIRVFLSKPGTVRRDADLTTEISEEKSTTGNWVRELYPKTALAEFVKIDNEARGATSKFTMCSLPWQEGFRIVPMDNFLDVTETLRKIKSNKWAAAIHKFKDDYPSIIEWAKNKHGDYFDEEFYPPFEELVHKFRFDVQVLPIPQKEDFRVKLADEDIKQIQDGIDAQLVEAMETAKRDVLQKVMKPIQHMVEKLKNADSTFRDSLVGNIKEVVSLIPSLNLMDDKDLVELHSSIESTLTQFTAQDLRDSTVIRNATANEAEKILNKMKSYF